MRALLLFVVLFAFAAGATPVILEGELPTDGPAFVMIPFDVPAGTVEIEIAHPKQQAENILDYGVFDPSFRGWGGGNSENLIIGVQAASRSYLPGPITPGQWAVVIGKAKVIVSPARYRLEIETRTTATLAPQTVRAPYSPVKLKDEARWYAGDFHVHSRESGDAQPSADAIALFAAMRGLDFVELSEHNTTASVSWLNDVQSRHPNLLLLPGVEFTTYSGHANGIGATKYVDHRLGLGDVTLDTALAEFATQDVVFSIDHPLLDLGTTCIGCAWKQKIPREQLGAVEIGTGGWDKTGVLFTKQVIPWWERLVAQGIKAAPIGGSDDHSGGVDTGQFDSPIGAPTTMVFASSLEPSAIVAGVRAGRTVVKLQGPDDPMIDLRVNESLVGSEVSSTAATLTARVTNGSGSQLVVLRDGVEWKSYDVAGADETFTEALAEGGRYRAEVRINSAPRTVTNNLWVTLVPKPPAGCSTIDAPLMLALVALLRCTSARRR
ncbi:MAG: CehA/McbA family metallohydrolase [Archangium sp.]